MTDRSTVVLPGKQIQQTPTPFPTSILHNPENLISQCTDPNLNQEDDDLDSLPSNLDVHSFHVKTNSSQDCSQEEQEAFEVYRPKANFARFTYFHTRESQLSQIKECNNQSSSIIYLPSKKPTMVNMPDIVEERNQASSGQKWTGRNSSADEKESNDDAETAIQSEIQGKQPIKQAWRINVKMVVFVCLLVFIAAALYTVFKPTKMSGKKASKMREERQDQVVISKDKKAHKAK